MFLKQTASPWIFGTLLAVAAGALLLRYHRGEMADQRKHDLNTLDLQWSQGSNMAKGKPVNEAWLREGVYLVTWSWCQEGSTETNYLAMLSYMGKDHMKPVPVGQSDTMYFRLKTNLVSGCLYRIELTKRGPTYKPLSSPRR